MKNYGALLMIFMISLLPIILLSCSDSGGFKPDLGKVKIYKGIDYSGTRGEFFISLPDLNKNGFNDCISSIRVADGWRATLYRDTYFLGISETFTGDDPDLSDNIIGNNTASSIFIKKVL